MQQYKLNFHGAGNGYDSIIPDVPHDVSDPLTEKLGEKVGKYVEQYVEAMEKVVEAFLLQSWSIFFFSSYFCIGIILFVFFCEG